MKCCEKCEYRTTGGGFLCMKTACPCHSPSPKDKDWREKLTRIMHGRQFQQTEIEALIEAEIEAAKAEEHQFFLNILDGIDDADRIMGVTGGTKAIRFALKSRFINHPPSTDLKI